MTESTSFAPLPEGFPLDDVSARVIGSLIEKSMTTPDNYPLSLNAVTTACNQVSNREPVVEYSDDTVERTLRTLADDGIASLYHKPGDRVVKYVHKLDRALEIGPQSTSLLAVLMLRGPQTPGELRQRTQRYGTFESLAEVEGHLTSLVTAMPPLAERLPRRPGQKEQRYRQLIATADDVAFDPMDTEPAARAPDAAPTNNEELVDRMAALEERFGKLLDVLGVDDI